MLPEAPAPALHSCVTTRRHLLTLSAAGTTALLLALRAGAQATKPTAGSGLTLEEFLDEVHPLAKRLLTGDQPEDAYLYEVASRAVRLLRLPEVELHPFPAFEHVTFARRGEKRPLSLMQFFVEPDTAIPLHDHRGYNGVMLGLDGEFRVRSFDPADGKELPATGEVRLRQTADSLVTAGRVSTLARTRDNLHLVTAGRKGGMALDVFTMIERAGPARMLDLQDKPVDPAARIFVATPRPG